MRKTWNANYANPNSLPLSTSRNTYHPSVLLIECRTTMTRLTQTHVDHSTIEAIGMESVEFNTGEGRVKVSKSNNGIILEIGFKDVSPQEMADLLNDVADDEHMDLDALEVAFGIVAEAAAEQTDEDEGNDNVESDDEAETDEDTTEVIHTLEDGTEIRVGDRINHRDGSTYKITGRASSHTLSKLDISDSPEITHRRVAQDVQQRGFAERVAQ